MTDTLVLDKSYTLLQSELDTMWDSTHPHSCKSTGSITVSKTNGRSYVYTNNNTWAEDLLGKATFDRYLDSMGV